MPMWIGRPRRLYQHLMSSPVRPLLHQWMRGTLARRPPGSIAAAIWATLLADSVLEVRANAPHQPAVERIDVACSGADDEVEDAHEDATAFYYSNRISRPGHACSITAHTGTRTHPLNTLSLAGLPRVCAEATSHQPSAVRRACGARPSTVVRCLQL